MHLPNWTYLVVFIIGIGLCWYVMRGCENNPGPDHSQDKVYVDSLVKKAISDSVIAKQTVAHLTDSLSQFRRANDSLEREKNKKEALVNAKEEQIFGWISRIDSLKYANDTAGQLKGCDSLKGLYEDAAKIVGGYEYVSDSLIDRLKLERHLSDSVKNYLWVMFTEANNRSFSIGLKYDNLAADYKKINVKPKRFGIGPSAGAFITNKGMGYGVGINVHFDIFRF